MIIGLNGASAQEQTIRVRGTIERVDGDTLTIKARNGVELAVNLTKDARAVAIARASLADIKPGAYVGVAALPQPDGSQRALEVHIFPESMRGVGDGHRPWDLAPGSTMTNGSVEQQVAGIEGQTLKLKYRDGEKNISVTPQTQIVIYEEGNRADLKPGTKVFISSAVKKPDATFEATRINYGKDGVEPPM
jgi:hypothetical protein